MAVRDVVQAAAGVGGGGEYVEDVFSTYLYTGNGSTQTITNGIDLAGEGGLVWCKARSVGNHGRLFDTARGVQKAIYSSLTSGEATESTALTAFNADGFTLGSNDNINGSGATNVSWTFRKSPKFFDIVTYTGNGASNRQISHSLGSTPGMLTTKRTDAAGSWNVQHRSMAGGDGTAADWTRRLLLESTTSSGNDGLLAPTSEVFYATDGYNLNGATYVAYLFAHDAGGFGDDGEQNVISCGSFTTDGSGNATVSLGYEPQWVMVKRSDGVDDWYITDSMRGFTVSGSDSARLRANSSAAEALGQQTFPSSTGFTFAWTASATFIYIAIRRPMKTPESGTEVFESTAYTGNATTQRQIGSTVLMDAFLLSCRSANSTGWSTYAHMMADRLRGDDRTLSTSNSAAEVTGWATNIDLDTNIGWDTSSGNQGYMNNSGSTFVCQTFKRAPGFMDVVCYTGTGSATTVAHNLAAVPELIVLKHRNGADNWVVGHKEFNWLGPIYLNEIYGYIGDNIAWWNNTAPTSTEFTIGSSGASNTNTGTYVAYLFATLAGVSKVGSYTGTGADLNVDCGFSSGARFILIKRTDSTGDWYVWDSARGIVAGNDPYLLLNSTAAEVTSTDYIDPLASGFTVTSTAPAALNASGGSFIFFAVA